MLTEQEAWERAITDRENMPVCSGIVKPNYRELYKYSSAQEVRCGIMRVPPPPPQPRVLPADRREWSVSDANYAFNLERQRASGG